jgi:hypothetical protein
MPTPGHIRLAVVKVIAAKKALDPQISQFINSLYFMDFSLKLMVALIAFFSASDPHF